MFLFMHCLLLLPLNARVLLPLNARVFCWMLVLWCGSWCSIFFFLDRGSYTSAHVLLNLLNELGKRDKMRGFFCNECVVIKFLNKTFACLPRKK